jgi:hypothetical protein
LIFHPFYVSISETRYVSQIPPNFLPTGITSHNTRSVLRILMLVSGTGVLPLQHNILDDELLALLVFASFFFVLV